MYALTRGETASSMPSLPAAVPATQYRRLKTHLAIAWFGMDFFFFPTPKTNDLWKTQARESQTIRKDTRHFTS